MNEAFLVSLLYWIGILILFLWLNRRLSRVSGTLAELEKLEKRAGQGP